MTLMDNKHTVDKKKKKLQRVAAHTSQKTNTLAALACAASRDHNE
jgi:hypothetical protein